MLRLTSMAGAIALVAAAIACPVASGQARPGTAAATTLPSKALEEGWERTDQRLVFLASQLSSVEQSLRAVNKAIVVTGYKQQVQADKAGTARAGSELMDRKGGAPVPWDQFYGKTARQFAVTVPPGTITVTNYKGPATDFSYPTNDPLRRPKQFDYIYRANAENEKRAEAEAAALGGKVESLVARRRQLEAEQSGLWCKIAFQLIEGRDLAAKPLYHFALKGGEGADAQRVEAVRALAGFARVAELAAGQAVRWVEVDQARAFADLRKNVNAARVDLQATLMAQPALAREAGDAKTELGRCLALAKGMEDVAANVSDAHRLALARDQAEDAQQKELFRGALQESVLNYAAAVLKLDETVLQVAEQWKVIPDTATPAPAVKLIAATEAPAAPVTAAVTSHSDAPAAASAAAPAATDTGSKRAVAVKPVDVVVTGMNNQARPKKSGVRVTRGQMFVITPDPAGRWGGGGSRGRKLCDYRGYFPNKNDPWMKMFWRVGTTTMQVASGQPVAAPADGEIELMCWDGKVDKNIGEIRATVEVK
jgi:hypothetical protein